MSFVSTAFLIALPLVAAPLLLHLFDRRRNEVIQWGAMQFLMEASAKKTSARRLKQWLLLLLRCLAIAALILALAGPLLPAGYLGGGGRGETIFVVDNSMSMSRKTASGTMIGDAASRAIERLGELPSRDDVRIMTTAPYPSWIGTGTVRSDSRNQKWLAEQLHGIDATQGRSDLLAALFTAVQVQHEPTQHSRKIVVLTDGQAADWRLDDQTGWKRLQTALGQAPVPTKIETIRLDQSATQSKIGNVGIDEISLDRNVVGAGSTITATATLHNYAPSTADAATLVWEVDGEELFRQSLDPIEGEQTSDANFKHGFEATGTYRLSCRLLRDDDLPADNVASRVVEVVDQIPIVIVEGAFELAEMQQDSYFIQAALGWIDGQPLSETSIYVPTLVSPDELGSTNLSKQRVVVIPSLTDLPAPAVARLTEFVSEGGGLWLGLGPRTDVDFYNHQLFADASGLAPLRLDRIVDSAPAGVVSDVDQADSHEPRLTHIDPFRSEHPATRQLADNDQLDLADAVIDRYFKFVAADDAEDLSVLLRLNDGTPLVVENFVGRGRVIVQATPLRLQWSDLARTQSFVVMVRDWIDYLAEPRATNYNLLPGQPIVYRVADNDDAARDGLNQDGVPTGLLRIPGNESIELTAQYSDDALEFRTSRTRRPGQYNLEIGLSDRGIPFQVKRSAEESNLAQLSGEAWQGIQTATTADLSAEQPGQVASSQADPVWPYLLFALIGLITAELVLSGLMARERFGSAGIAEFSEMDSAFLGSSMSLTQTQLTQTQAPSQSEKGVSTSDLLPAGSPQGGDR